MPSIPVCVPTPKQTFIDRVILDKTLGIELERSAFPFVCSFKHHAPVLQKKLQL